MAREDGIAVWIAFVVICGQIVSDRWTRNIPRMFYPKRVAKEREIEKLQRDALPLNTQETFHLYSKVQRQVIAAERELLAINEAYRGKGLFFNWFPTFVAWVVAYGLMLPACMLWGRLQLVMVPNYLAQSVLTVVFRGSLSQTFLNACWLIPSLVLEIAMFVCPAASVALQQLSLFDASARHGDELLRSLNVVAWYIAVLITWRYTKRVFS